MLTELYTESKKDELKMHLGKTKAFFNDYVEKEIKVDNKEIKLIEECIYVRKVAVQKKG